MSKCNVCGYDDNGTGDSAHVCSTPIVKMTTNNEFEKWYHQYIDNGYSAQAFEVNMFEAWQAATTEANKRMAELESEVAELKHDRNQWYKDAQDKRLRILELQAHINTLRQVLCYYREECTGFEPSISVFNLKLDKALSATPAESLQAHDNEVISKCAYICDSWKRHDVIDECCDTAQNIALLAVSDAIRALKEVK